MNADQQAIKELEERIAELENRIEHHADMIYNNHSEKLKELEQKASINSDLLKALETCTGEAIGRLEQKIASDHMLFGKAFNVNSKEI